MFSCELAMNYAKSTIKLLDRSLGRPELPVLAIAHNELKQGMSLADMFKPEVSDKAVQSRRTEIQSRWAAGNQSKDMTASCLSFPYTTIIHTRVGMGSIPRIFKVTAHAHMHKLLSFCCINGTQSDSLPNLTISMMSTLAGSGLTPLPN